METVLVIVVYSIVFVKDFLPILKQKHKVEIGAYSLLLLISFGMMLLVSVNIKLPSLSKPINALIETLFGIKV